jgi:nucleoside-diphosphate-sugar epimerase
MRVLVTGATGFVGGHLVPALIERDHEVLALVRPDRDASALEALGARVIRGDVTDPVAVETAARGVETVVHLAVPRRVATLRHHRAVSVGGAENVLASARAAGVARIVHCSTVGVYGRLRSLPADEATPFRPETAYQVAKAEAEGVVQRHERRHGAHVVVVRPTMVYGPGDLASLKLYRAILSGRLLSVGRASQPWQGVYVDDLVQALLLALTTRDAVGESFVIADSGAIPQVDVFRAIAAAGGARLRRSVVPAWLVTAAVVPANAALRPLGRQAPFTKSLHFFTHPRSFDISKAQRVLGYRPRVALEEGVRRTLAWYREQGYVPR